MKKVNLTKSEAVKLIAKGRDSAEMAAWYEEAGGVEITLTAIFDNFSAYARASYEDETSVGLKEVEINYSPTNGLSIEGEPLVAYELAKLVPDLIWAKKLLSEVYEGGDFRL